jgi:hypothetical protein
MSDREDNSRPPEESELHLDDVQHPETLYDRSDLSRRGVLVFLIGLAITVLLIHIVTWGLFRYFAQNQLSAPPRSFAIIQSAGRTGRTADPTQTFPAPQLQPDPVADLNKFRAAVDERLNTYGWVEQKGGVLHIPIERAIDVVAQQGLPTRPPPALSPRATFASGIDTAAGAGGGTEPKGNK